MPTLTVVKNYLDATTLTQAQLDQAFTSVETFINTTKLDSTNLQSNAVVTATITPAAVTTATINAAAVTIPKLGTDVTPFLVPTGALMPYVTSSAPTGWLNCDGSAVSRSTYAALYSVIGTSYGVGDGSTTFNVPSLGGKVPMGVNGSYALASSGGEATHTLTTTEMPSHNHTDSGHSHSYNISSSDSSTIGTNPATAALFVGTGGTLAYNNQPISTVSTAGVNGASASIQNTGGGAAHNNLQPYVVFNYIIKT